jgi:hypothetical protein
MLVAACGPIAIAPTLEPGARPPADVHIANGSTLDVTVKVNGTNRGILRAGEATTIVRSQMPDPPWNVEVSSPAGRLIIGAVMSAADVASIGGGTASMAVFGPMVCGTVVVYVGDPPPPTEPGQDPCGP